MILHSLPDTGVGQRSTAAPRPPYGVLPSSAPMGDLLAMAQVGNPSACNALLERHLPALKRIAERRVPAHTRGVSDGEDLVQEALIRAVKNLESFEMRHETALLAYLRRSVINRVVDEVRRARRRPFFVPLSYDSPTSLDSPLDELICCENAARYRAALARLRVRDCQAILMRVELRATYEEMARRLGIASPNAARVATTRALRRLARVVAADAAAADCLNGPRHAGGAKSAPGGARST